MTDRWEELYRQGTPPWDIGRPQPAIVQLVDSGDIQSPVLDSGCGTGDNALLLAARGYEVLGVDIAPLAIERARAKAAERGLAAEFELGDILDLDRLGRTFRTVIDSAAFHIFEDPERAKYVKSLASAVEPDGVAYILCFSELTPGDLGPRRVTQAELRDSFADGWKVQRIDAVPFEVDPEWMREQPRGWLAKIVRRPS